MGRNRAGSQALRARVAFFAAIVANLVTIAAAGVARAQRDERREEEEGQLVLMNEPATFTDVSDAFDDHDVFDVNITLGYLRTWEIGRLQRETNTPPEGGADVMSRRWQDVADYTREVNQLILGLEVGVFRDLALYAQLPIILSDDRRLDLVGERRPELGALLSDRSPAAGLFFDLPFRSPTRSGIDWLAVGAMWSILNQTRDPHVPTWVIMLEGRFNLGDPMFACNDGAADRASRCITGNVEADGTLRRGSNAGVGRGVNALRAETRGSFRYEYMEPYAGLAFQMEWPGSADRSFLPQGNLAGYINDLPPIQGRLTLGVAIMPWEDREHYQRFAIDLRFTADYFSEGHDYSPLFDALGSSSNPYLTQQALEGQPNSPGDSLAAVNFYGLTDTQSHARLGGTVVLEMRAARYVRFMVQTTVMHTPSYVITQADACNPNVSPSSTPSGVPDPRGGTCRSGIINPHHRPVIDLPGHRFRMESVTQIDIAAYVTAMF